MTISGDKKNLGKVLYASKCFLKFTEIPTDLVKTFFFSNFIPRSYSKDHDQLLAHFTKNYTESVIYKSLPLFLVNYYGYLCEFFVSLECVGDKDSIRTKELRSTCGGQWKVQTRRTLALRSTWLGM